MEHVLINMIEKLLITRALFLIVVSCIADMAEELNYEQAQSIYLAEQIRCSSQDLTTIVLAQDEDDELEGEPLSLKEVRKLCNNHFVRNTLFRVSGNAKETAPLKLSDLQHVGLARVLLQRFIRQERALPNNNQVAIYFVQQCYVQYILRRRVNWDDRPRTAGVGRGRIADKVAANMGNTPPPPRKRPVVLLPEEHTVIENLATQGIGLASQGETVEGLRATIADLQNRLQISENKVARYFQLYGALPEADNISGSSLGTDDFRVSDLMGDYAENLN